MQVVHQKSSKLVDLYDSAEDPVALLVDDLLALVDRKGSRIVLAGMRLGAHEPVLPHAGFRILLDDPRRLVSTLGRVRRWTNAEALVLDGLGSRLLAVARAASACKTVPE